MGPYIARRLLAVLFLVFGISILVFSILRLIPGDPATAMLGTNAGSYALVKLIHHQLGLDLPLPVQYIRWMGGLLRGDLGYSYDQSLPVTTLIAGAFPYTAQLAIVGLAMSVICGVSIGVLAAVKRNTIIDTLAMGIALIGSSLPVFWLGILLIELFGVHLRWFPVFSGTSNTGLVLPALSLGITGAGFTARFVRSAVINTLRQQFVITARSKGLNGRRLLRRHVLRNSILPVLTIVGLQFGNLLSGAVIVEVLFSRPGIGRLLVDSLLNKDYVVVQGDVLLIALLYLFSNLLVDLLYPVLDPSIAHG